MTDDRPRASAKTLAAVLALAAALALFISKPVRFALEPGYGWDFRNCYVSGRAFLEGRNPYDPDVQAYLLVRDTGVGERDALAAGNLIIFPPGNMLFFAPLALFPYRVALRLWLLASELALVGMALSVRRLFGPAGGLPGLLLSLALLHLAHPVWEAFWAGQPGLVMSWLCLLALQFAHEDRELPSGLALGLALLKYNLSLPVLLYLLLKRRLTAVRVALLLALALNLLPLLAGDLEALVSNAYQNMVFSFGEGGLNNQRSPAASFNDVSLPVLLWRLWPDGPAALVTTLWLGGIGLLAGALAFVSRGREFRPLEVAALLAFCLLFVYHRNYDSPILFGAAMAVAAEARARRLRPALAVAAGLCLVAFFFKNSFEDFPPRLVLDRFELLVRLSYRNWCLLALAGLLTLAAWQRDTPPAPAPPVDPSSGPAPRGAGPA
ncbi:MAG: DUF2029 domain-containing protein [Planctomycetes bacterium]|nr:DUF2029 domain-containing protein [Planctomycetota bacterium]